MPEDELRQVGLTDLIGRIESHDELTQDENAPHPDSTRNGPTLSMAPPDAVLIVRDVPAGRAIVICCADSAADVGRILGSADGCGPDAVSCRWPMVPPDVTILRAALDNADNSDRALLRGDDATTWWSERRPVAINASGARDDPADPIASVAFHASSGTTAFEVLGMDHQGSRHAGAAVCELRAVVEMMTTLRRLNATGENDR